MVHELYGSELGLTSDDDDYVDPSAEDDPSNKLRVRKAARVSTGQDGRSSVVTRERFNGRWPG